MHVPVVGLVGSMNNAIFSTYMSITVTHMFTLQMEMKITLHCIDKAEHRMKKTRREIYVSTVECHVDVKEGATHQDRTT